ncbi:MAG: arylformamidase [Saprospiraceae bacterium]|jgi:arylformamidase
MISIQINSKSIQGTADLNNPIDISIPLKNGKNNPNTFFLPSPKIGPIIGENFVGDVNQGGSCNCDTISLTPHGNGTHTECVGHISSERNTINASLNNFHFLAKLITITPKEILGDFVITKAQIRAEFESRDCEALIIRTKPNSIDKKTKTYSGNIPAYIENEAIRLITHMGIKHLLIDLPSVDKEEDGGVMIGHHTFFNYPISPKTDRTITEMIYVDNKVEDGYYLLNLLIAPIESDASPSKPIIYPIK